jgi:hypothetical protein
MLVTAKVIAEAYDSKTSEYFYPGTIEGFDPDSEKGKRLAELTTPLGKYIFQYPGHDGLAPGKSGRPVTSVIANTTVSAAAAGVKARTPMSAADRKKKAQQMLAGKQRKRRETQERIEAETAAV